VRNELIVQNVRPMIESTPLLVARLPEQPGRKEMEYEHISKSRTSGIRVPEFTCLWE
jgi:hypothetical protein